MMMRLAVVLVVQRASASFGEDLSGRVSVHHVRDVAPRKPMLCLSFPLW